MFIQHQKKLYVNKLEDLSLLKFQRGYLYFLIHYSFIFILIQKQSFSKMVASNSKKVIATKCRTACLRAIQRLVDTEQNYTRTFLKLKSDERDNIIRINKISKNKTNELILFNIIFNSYCKKNK